MGPVRVLHHVEFSTTPTHLFPPEGWFLFEETRTDGARTLDAMPFRWCPYHWAMRPMDRTVEEAVHDAIVHLIKTRERLGPFEGTLCCRVERDLYGPARARKPSTPGTQG